MSWVLQIQGKLKMRVDKLELCINALLNIFVTGMGSNQTDVEFASLFGAELHPTKIHTNPQYLKTELCLKIGPLKR